MDTLLQGLAIFGLALIAMVIVMRREQRRFEEKFPPISDEEFVARCSPGTSPDVALRVRRMIAEHLAVPYERVSPTMRFIDDLGSD